MARLCLALLRNSNSCLQVVQESVRNFDMVSYHRGNPRGFPLFLVAGGGLEQYKIVMPSVNTDGIVCKYKYLRLLCTCRAEATGAALGVVERCNLIPLHLLVASYDHLGNALARVDG